MALRTVYSTNRDANTAAAEIAAGLADLNLEFVLFFASPVYAPEEIGPALRERLGRVSSLGCTTAGELVTGKVLKQSIVAMGFDRETVRRAHVAHVAEISDPAATTRALGMLSEGMGSAPPEWDPTTNVGLVLHDGMSAAEEGVMERLSGSTNLPFVGGSAGDDTAFKQTHVFTNFEPSTGSSALSVLELAVPYHVLKTQSFEITDSVLEATDVDEATRTVKSFNGQPASEEYARALGVSVADLPNEFRAHPLGLVVGEGEPYVRSPQQGRGTDVRFYCQVKEGMKLNVLRSVSIIERTKRDLDEAIQTMPSCSGIINFNCIQRTLELEARGKTAEYGALFKDIPSVGFSTYGESYIGHINQTATIVLIG